jgi:hypothetical protein
LLSVVAQDLIYYYCVQVLLSPLPAMPLMAIISGKSRLLVMDSILNPVAGVELPKKVFTSRAR